jgi:DNA-binding response OmpR family regulator
VLLLVDDDLQLRTAMRDFLSEARFQVLEARNTYDGMFLMAQYGACIDLLITEINLLPVGGIKLAENALRLNSSLRVICMSDPFDGPGMDYWMRYLGAQYLKKPFTPLELHERVQAALGRPPEISDVPIDYRSPTSSQFWERPEGSASSLLERQGSDNQDPTFWLREF